MILERIALDADGAYRKAGLNVIRDVIAPKIGELKRGYIRLDQLADELKTEAGEVEYEAMAHRVEVLERQVSEALRVFERADEHPLVSSETKQNVLQVAEALYQYFRNSRAAYYSDGNPKQNEVYRELLRKHGITPVEFENNS